MLHWKPTSSDGLIKAFTHLPWQMKAVAIKARGQKRKKRKRRDLGVGSRQSIDQWGILQSHGGPCGVLAVIQAEMIKSLQIYNMLQDKERQGNITREDAEKALCEALGLILARCALAPSVDSSSGEVAADAETTNSNSNTWSNTTTNMSMSPNNTDGVKLVQPMYEDEIPSIIEYGSYNAKLKCTHIQAVQDTATTTEYQGTNPPDRKRSKGPAAVNANAIENMNSPQQRQNQTKLQNLAKATAMHLMENDLLKLFKRTGGVILLAMSMIQTRGFDRIKNGRYCRYVPYCCTHITTVSGTITLTAF